MAKVCASLMIITSKKQNMKKLLLSLLITFLSQQGFAFDFESDGISYNIISAQDKTVEVTTGKNAYAGNIVISSTVMNEGVSYSVIKIGDYAFAGCSSLISISFSEGLEEFGISSFSGCTSLKTISLPSTVTELGTRCFSACSLTVFRAL